MSTVPERVKAQKTPLAAILHLAEEVQVIVDRINAIDKQLSNSGGVQWDSWTDEAFADQVTGSLSEPAEPVQFADPSDFRMSLGTQGEVKEVKKATDKQVEMREGLLRFLAFENLAGMPGVEGTQEELERAYVVAGPEWLYIGNRDYVMGLPPSTRQAMFNDWLISDPVGANDFARDTLMEREAQPPDTGPQSENPLAMTDVDAG